MNLENENNAEERRKIDPTAAADKSDAASARPRRAKPKDKKRTTPEVGQALRTIYQRTIEENIPSEMLDLLGKLD